MLFESVEVRTACPDQVSHDAESQTAMDDFVDGMNVKALHRNDCQTECALRSRRTPGITAVSNSAIA